MSVYLAGADEVGGGEDDEGSEGTHPHEDGHRHSGIARAGTHREHELNDNEGSEPPPQSFSRAADDHAQLALVESVHAEANLGLLVRGLQNLVAGAGAARDAHASLSRELATLRELLAKQTEAETMALARLQSAESSLESIRGDAARERARFIEEEDRFLAELLADHHRELAALRTKLDEALSREPRFVPAPVPVTEQTDEQRVEKLGSAATQPSFPAANWEPRGPEFPVAEWATQEPAFALTDWVPEPPFSLKEFAEERRSSEFELRLEAEGEVKAARPSLAEELATRALEDEPPLAVTRPADSLPPPEPAAEPLQEPSLASDVAPPPAPSEALRGVDPEDTPLPSWQAISTLDSLRFPPLSPGDDAAAPAAAEPAAASGIEDVVQPDPVALDVASPSSSQTGAVIGVLKPRSARLPRMTPEPLQLFDEVTHDDLEPLTVRGRTPDPGPVKDDPGPHLVDTVRPPPLIKPKPDFSTRPLREYSFVSSDIAEERVKGSESDPPSRR